MHVWNFAPVWANADLLALGLLNTLKVTGAALAFGVPLGLVLARDDLPVKAWADLDKPAVRIAVPQASSMDKFLTENVAKAQISRFPGNAEAIAAFQAGRADAVCLFHPPLLAARQKLGAGKIVVPTPAQSQASSVAVRKEADKSWVEWVDKEIGKFYASGQTQKWYEEFLVGFGLDPTASPPVMKEMLGKS